MGASKTEKDLRKKIKSEKKRVEAMLAKAPNLRFKQVLARLMAHLREIEPCILDVIENNSMAIWAAGLLLEGLIKERVEYQTWVKMYGPTGGVVG